MMDGIEFIKLGETYIKFDFEYTEENKQLLRGIFEKQIAAYPSRGIYAEGELKISIDFEKGSLKTKVCVWATAISIGVANYGSFRAGLREIINDVNQFSEYIIENVINDSNICSTDIIRTEKRTGLTGRIQELYQKIGRLERNTDNLSLNDFRKELAEIKQEIANILFVISESDRTLFLSDLDKNYKQKLPKPDDRRTTYLLSRYGLKSDDEIEVTEE